MRKILLIILIAALFTGGCSVYKTVSNISRLKYKIHSAKDYKLLGIELKEKKSVKDFNSLEILKLSAGLIKGSLPLTFQLNIEAVNPNDGSGGFEKTDLTLESFPWKLLLNEKETVNGNIEKPIAIPGKGESVIIPIAIQINAAKLIKDKNLDDVIALILQIGGVKGSTSNLKLLAQPVIGTPFGKIEYPGEITVVDKTFN